MSSASPEHGTVEQFATAARYGQPVRIRATAQPGYVFAGWVSSTAAIIDAASAETFCFLNGDAEITALFLPPANGVAQVTINEGDVQRSRILSIGIQLDKGVAIEAESAFRLRRISTGEDVGLAGAVLEHTDGEATARLLLVDIELADGDYELHLLPGAFTSASGGTLDVDGDGLADGGSGRTLAVPFHKLLGDLDGDRTVTARDILAVRSAVGSNSGGTGFNPGADLNNDGTVTGADMRAANGRRGISLP